MIAVAVLSTVAHELERMYLSIRPSRWFAGSLIFKSPYFSRRASSLEAKKIFGHDDTIFFFVMAKPRPGDISIVDLPY